ncbi:MAG: phosphoribosylamine--glycine ligase [Deltaproteobacteria bacterium]|nr:phosphoribosylamine--glycine ligase [Deltaproteobacteria bacterium]
MKVLVIGSGGREHALVWKLSQSPRVKKIYCAPGNAGIGLLAECVSLAPEDVAGLAGFARSNSIDLTIVGPELPLSLGLVDEFERQGLKVFGPLRKAAVLEFSKCFTKEFCARHKIPTAPFQIFTDPSGARQAVKERKSFPVVIKADGLAAGKGVIVAKDEAEALKAVKEMLVDEKFGPAGRKVILEEFLPGVEATFMVLANGADFVCLETSQDHKRVFDNDEGPNTGGMGAISPAPAVTKEINEKVIRKIIQPALMGLLAEDRPYRGVLYAGLMIRDDEPHLIEFNCRFGDPEAQAILFRLESDLIELIEAAMAGKLKSFPIQFRPEPSVCVVMTAGGYPGPFEKGKVILGLDKASGMKDLFVFHAGTRKDNGGFVTHGGRVLGVTAQGRDFKKAIERAYEGVYAISWEGVHFRRDIGAKILMRPGTRDQGPGTRD